MMKAMVRIWIFVSVVILLAGCTLTVGGNRSTPTPLPPEVVASPMPTLAVLPTETKDNPRAAPPIPSDPLELMLYSHTRWDSLWVDLTYTQYAGDAANTTVAANRYQVWLEHPNKGRVLSGAAQGRPERLWVSDGQVYRETGGIPQDLPPSLFGNYSPPALPSDSVNPHPFGSFMGPIPGEFIFSTGLAQRSGEFRPVGSETVAGRETLILEYFRYPDMPVFDRLWIDAQTGVILRFVSFGKPPGGPLDTEVLVNAIEYDLAFGEAVFEVEGVLPEEYVEGP